MNKITDIFSTIAGQIDKLQNYNIETDCILVSLKTYRKLEDFSMNREILAVGYSVLKYYDTEIYPFRKLEDDEIVIGTKSKVIKIDKRRKKK